MACQVQNQFQQFETTNPSILAHHEFVLKKLSALSVYMESQGKGTLDRPTNRASENSEAARDWYAEAHGHFASGGYNAPRSAALPIPPPPFQFSAQPTSPVLSTSAPPTNSLGQSPPSRARDLPRVASFSSGWHDTGGVKQNRESLALSAARFYEQKRRASMASHKTHSPPGSFHRGSPLGKSPSFFPPRELSQDSLSSGSCGRSFSPGGSFQEGGFFFAPGENHLVPGSPTSPLSAGNSGDSNPVSPVGTHSDQSGHSSSMEGATKFRTRNYDLEAESVLAKNVGVEEDRLAPLVGRGLRKGLSRHYGGKSRSFTCLADVVTSPIQDLAKPENPYVKRRKNNNGSHSNLLGRASSGNYGNFPQSPMRADNLGFRGELDSEMDDVQGGAFEWAVEGGDVATALPSWGRPQPVRSQSMADLRVMGRRRSSPEC